MPPRPPASPFAPQRVVAATRAPCFFYRRPRAFRRRAGGSAGEAPGRGARGGGERHPSYGGGAPAGSLPDRAAERAERSRKEPKRRCGGRAESGDRGGRMGREGARQGWGPAVQWSHCLRPGGPRCCIRPALPAPRILQSCPSPPCRESSAPHPAPPPMGALPGLQRRAGQKRSLRAGQGCCAPGSEKRPVPKGEVSHRTSFLLPSFPRRRLRLRPKSAYSGAGV